jgi:hypothetical protein
MTFLSLSSAFAALLLSLAPTLQDSLPMVKKVDSLMKAKRYAQAEVALEKITAAGKPTLAAKRHSAAHRAWHAGR